MRQIPLERRTRRLSEAEITRLGATIRQSREDAELPAGLASIQLMLLTGFRRMEALGLRYAWLDEHCVRFPDTKTGKQLRIIGRAARSLIDLQRVVSDQTYVFPSERNEGHLISADRVLQRLCVTAQLESVSLHTLRHTFASVAADLGYTELTIAGLLGHAAQGVTQRYVHVDRALVAAADQISTHIAGLLGLDLIASPAITTLNGPAAQIFPGFQEPLENAFKRPTRLIEAVATAPESEGVSAASPLRPLRTEEDYEAAVGEYRRYLATLPAPGTEAASRFEVLGLLICTFEEARRPASFSPTDALIRIMNCRGKTEQDLAVLLGTTKASDILSGARPLSVDHIRQLRAEWGVPAALLV